MLGDTSEYQFFINKRTDKIYISKAIEQIVTTLSPEEGFQEISRPFRIISKVFDNIESHQFVKQGKELVLRITEGQRHEIVAKVYEDTRGVFILQIQKFTANTGSPHKSFFTFRGDEIKKLYDFIRVVALVPITSKESHKIDAKHIDELIQSKDEALKALLNNPDLITEILKHDITKSDIVALGYRKAQLNIFEKLLTDEAFFNTYKADNGIIRDEAVWQAFFEKNTWIFGYGLNYIFNSPLEGKKLEQVVSGYNTFSSGKRIDALMQTKGLTSTLCFGEIKTHHSPLLNSEYRSECFSISKELAGGIAQVQKTLQKSLKELNTKLELKDTQRNPTGESVYIYQPKAFLVIGCLEEFKTPHGINEDKYSSFELFRRNINNPEIITFDELFHRAKYIVESTEH